MRNGIRLLALAAMAIAPLNLNAQDKEPPKPDEKAASQLPPETKKLIEEGNAAFQKSDFKAAKKAFSRMLEIVPGHPSALINLATAEYRLGNRDEAVKLLRQAVAAKSDAAPAWLTLGILELEAGRMYEAIAALATAISIEPNNARAHSYLGVAFGREGWFTAAEAELRKALEIAPDSADINFNLALTYLNRNPPSLELARRHYNAAIDLGSKPDPLVEKKLSANAPN